MDKYYEIMERKNAIVKEIWKMANAEILFNHRFFGSSLFRLKICESDCETIESNGDRLFYNNNWVINQYKNGKNHITHAYLHVLLHCIFNHMFVNSKINVKFWNLACDILVENVIYESFSNKNDFLNDNQKKEIIHLKNYIFPFTTERIYRYMVDNQEKIDIFKLSDLFTVDNHEIWYKHDNLMKNQKLEHEDGNPSDNETGNSSNQNNQMIPDSAMFVEKLAQEWKTISHRMKIDMETSNYKGGIGTESGSLQKELRNLHRERYNYAEFLRKFTTWHEEMKINEDEFDYIYYTYGLSLYKNIPLIEPLEYKESKKIKEFIIAIDTSGSTYDSLVSAFLKKTYNILLQKDSFFSKAKIHIIQCDTVIQSDVLITNAKEFKNYIDHLVVKGGGGTDFRPCFDYVNKLIKEKELFDLKGMIYFTDGFGVFPQKPPIYDVAFVFIDNQENNYDVPIWAMKLVLNENEIYEDGEKS